MLANSVTRDGKFGLLAVSLLMASCGGHVGGARDASGLTAGQQTPRLASGPKILVIAAVDDKTKEPELGLATQALDQAGLAYDKLITTKDGARVSDTDLALTNADGSPKYAGIVLTTGQVLFQAANAAWTSGLSDGQWTQLAAYEAKNHIRSVALYAYPLDTDGVALDGTGNGDEVFLGLNPDVSSQFSTFDASADWSLKGSWHYPTKISAPDRAKPALFFKKAAADATGEVGAALTTYADGHERLAFFFAQDPANPTCVNLGPQWIQWLRAAFPAVSTDQIAGHWSVTIGTGVPGTPPTAVGGADVAATSAGLYDITQVIGSATTYGTAVRQNDHLYAAVDSLKGDAGISVFALAPQGVLQGTWARDTETGTETIAGAAPDHLDGSYGISGMSSKFGAYSGLIRFTKVGDAYRVDWKATFHGMAQPYSRVGVATRSGTSVIVAWGTASDVSVVDFLLVGATAVGTGSRMGVTGVFAEELTR